MPTVIPATTNEVVEFLNSIKEFSALDSAGKGLLAALMQKQRCEVGHTFFNQGDAPSAVYFLDSGSVEVMKNGSVVATLSAFDFFGEMGILQSRPRNASVKMVAEGDVYILPGFLLEQLVQKEPTIELFFGSVLKERR